MPRPPAHRGNAGAAAGVPAPAVTTTSTDLHDLSYDDLYAMAQEQDVHGRSSMTKEELITALGG